MVAMSEVKNSRLPFAMHMVLPGFMCLFMAWPALAQEAAPAKAAEESAEKPAKEPSEKVEDGHDRPTTYPKIVFKPKDENAKPGEGAAAGKKVLTRAYLVDITDAMAASVTVKGQEVTRMERMITEVSAALDAWANRTDLHFNIITFGTVLDFAGGGAPLEFTAENIKNAKAWLKKLECKGTGDMYAMLKALFEQEPETATMVVGSMPARPADVSDEEIAKHENAAAFVQAQVKAWVAAGKKTKLYITGIGLTKSEREYYFAMAQATGAVYTDL